MRTMRGWIPTSKPFAPSDRTMLRKHWTSDDDDDDDDDVAAVAAVLAFCSLVLATSKGCDARTAVQHDKVPLANWTPRSPRPRYCRYWWSPSSF